MTKVRDSIRELAFHASKEFIVSQDQAKRILQDVIVRSTKREHHANRLTFTRKCINKKLAFNKIESATKKLKLSKRDIEQVKEKIMKKIGREMYQELSCMDKELSLSIREEKNLLSNDSWKRFDMKATVTCLFKEL